MNAYSVISETLYEHIPILDDGTGPDEPYAIAHVVVAESRSKAKWLAWKTDRKASWTGDPADMPRFAVRKLKGGVEGPARIATDEPEYEALWAAAAADDPGCLRAEIAAKGRDCEAIARAFLRRDAGGRCTVAVPDDLAGRDFEDAAAAIAAIRHAANLIDLSEPTPVP
jgi:hypothetical protein